jgi:peptidoglycan/LPS O-acetylase OafA/YrhL
MGRPLIKYDKSSILAGVRFLLASIVAINHMSDFTNLGWMGFVPAFGAFEAILGFLLISGYSISISYSTQPKGFLMRRIFRVYPIYIATIAAYYLLFISLKLPTPSWLVVGINLLFLNQVLTSTSFVGPAWSLSLEFWLYCLAPFLMRLSQSAIRWLVYASFVSFLIYTVLRSAAHLPYYSGLGFGANLPLLSFIWLAGLLLARSAAADSTALRDIGIIFGGHILVMALIQFGFRVKHHAVSLFFTHDILITAAHASTLAFVFLVFKYVVIPPGPALPHSWFLRLLGDLSYPLYLLHAVVFSVLLHLGLRSPLLFYLIAVAASAGIYWLLDFYSKKRHLERPSLFGAPWSKLAAIGATPRSAPGAVIYATRAPGSEETKRNNSPPSATS